MTAPPRDTRRFLNNNTIFIKEETMKTAITIMMTLVLIATSGCKTSSPRGGSTYKNEGFRIAVPKFDTNLKQGEVRAVILSLQRGDSFKQDVRVQVQASEGISVDPTDVHVKASESPDVQLRISAAKNAALGAYSISVKAMPKTGQPTSTTFTVTVVAP
jgi:CHASE2 domain-containing sensor protein